METMPRTIDRFYGSTFYLPPPDTDKEFGPYFRWKAPRKGPLIVFHPELCFDPYSADTREIQILARRSDRDWTIGPGIRVPQPFVPPEGDEILILHESFRIKKSVFSAIRGFIEDYPDFLRLADDDSPWYNTGFWSARCGEENCTGMSESGAEQYMTSMRHGDFAYVLCNSSTIIELATKMGSGLTWVDVYLNNRSLPWAEMRRAVQSTLDGIGRWASIGKEVGDQAGIMKGVVPRRWMHDGIRDTVSSVLKLVAVAKIMADVYHSAIVEWKFGTTPWAELNSMRYVLTSIGPYLDRRDFAANPRFAVRHFYPYFLRNCVVLDCGLERSQTEDSLELPDLMKRIVEDLG